MMLDLNFCKPAALSSITIRVIVKTLPGTPGALFDWCLVAGWNFAKTKEKI
jgi:hypothetical protein